MCVERSDSPSKCTIDVALGEDSFAPLRLCGAESGLSERGWQSQYVLQRLSRELASPLALQRLAARTWPSALDAMPRYMMTWEWRRRSRTAHSR